MSAGGVLNPQKISRFGGYFDTFFVQVLLASSSMANTLGWQSKGFNYGFVDYDDPAAAERAMQTLNGRRVHNVVC